MQNKRPWLFRPNKPLALFDHPLAGARSVMKLLGSGKQLLFMEICRCYVGPDH